MKYFSKMVGTMSFPFISFLYMVLHLTVFSPIAAKNKEIANVSQCDFTAVVQPSIGSVCPANCCVTLTALPTPSTGTYTYTWSVPNGTLTGQTIKATEVGTYVVSVTSDGCTVNASAIINPGPSVTISPSMPCASFGTTLTALVTADTGVAPFMYTWSTPSGTTPPSTSPTVIVSLNGTYTVTVIDANGCTGMASLVVNAPFLEIQSSTPCPTLTSTFTAIPVGGTPPYVSYMWTGPDGFTASTASITNLPAYGTYRVVVTDSAGCTAESFQHVEAAPTVTITPSPTCLTIGSTLIAVGQGGAGGLQYLWTLPDSSQQPGASLTVTEYGVYTVVVTDSNDCKGTATINVEPAPTISVSVSPNTCIAAGTVLTASATGGVGALTFSWATPSGTVLGNTVTVTANGTYTVTVVDQNNCSSSQSIVVGPAPSVSIIQPQGVCPSIGLTLQAVVTGTAPFTYLWHAPDGTTSTQPFITITSYGIYTVTVTDASMCSSNATFNVEPAPTVTIEGLTFGCAELGSTLVAVATGGVGTITYSWITPTGIVPGNTVTVSTLGTYIAVATDSNKCTGQASAHVCSTTNLSLLVCCNVNSIAVIVKNSGEIPLTGIQAVTLLPSCATLVSTAGSGWSSTVTGQTVTSIYSGTLMPGSTAALTLNLKNCCKNDSNEQALITVSSDQGALKTETCCLGKSFNK